MTDNPRASDVEIDEAKRLEGRPCTSPTALETDRGAFVDPTPTGMLRIDAIAAGAFAGALDTAEHARGHAEPTDDDCSITEVAEFEMPAWVDPPTGAVPRVLLEQSAVVDGTSGELLRGPTWRQEAESFLEDLDLSFLNPEDGPDDAMAGRLLDPEAPFAFSLERDRELVASPEAGELEVEATRPPGQACSTNARRPQQPREAPPPARSASTQRRAPAPQGARHLARHR